MKAKVLLVILLFSYMTTIPTSTAQSSFDDGPYAYLYYSNFSTLKIDGKVSTSEYPYTMPIYDKAGLLVSNLSWMHNNTHIAVALSSVGTGWVGLGTGDVGVTMAGSDIIMAYIKSNSLTIEDMYAIKQGKPKIDDNEYISSSNNINMQYANGTEENGFTTVEFVMPMSSSDTAGYDHQWSVGGTFGFFTAYHDKADLLTFKHKSHSDSLTVKILDNTYTIPTPVTQTLDFEVNNNNNSIEFISKVSGLSSLKNIEVGFYTKSLFGKILVGTALTDDTGTAKFDMNIQKGGNLTVVAVIPATESSIRSEVFDQIILDSSKIVETTETFNDLRGTFDNEHLMRSFVLFGFYLVIFSLLAVFIGVFIDIIRLGSKGKIKEIKEESK